MGSPEILADKMGSLLKVCITLCITSTLNSSLHTSWPSNLLVLKCVHTLTKGKEDPMNVSFFQAETGRHRAIAEVLGEESEGQENSVGQG